MTACNTRLDLTKNTRGNRSRPDYQPTRATVRRVTQNLDLSKVRRPFSPGQNTDQQQITAHDDQSSCHERVEALASTEPQSSQPLGVADRNSIAEQRVWQPRMGWDSGSIWAPGLPLARGCWGRWGTIWQYPELYLGQGCRRFSAVDFTGTMC